MYVYVLYVCMYVCVYVCMCMYVYACMYVCSLLCVCVDLRAYVHAYIYRYEHVSPSMSYPSISVFHVMYALLHQGWFVRTFVNIKFDNRI
jgi:hypothetical protein